MSNTKQFLENILKESDEVPYCDDVNCEPVKKIKKVKEAEEEQVPEEQPQEEVQTEEPVNDFERLSPEVQEILNDMSNDNAMYKSDVWCYLYGPKVNK